MSIVKEIKVKAITSQVANDLVRKVHYSGKIVPNSQLHLGAFYNGVLHGVMQFGPSMDKRKIQGLVRNTGWNDFIELNRMAFDDYLPKNSESRCISVAIKLLKKHAPNIKWVVSFADATQCGDGTIYRASGFVLTGLKTNNQIIEFPDGERVARLVITDARRPKRLQLAKKWGVKIGGASTMIPFLNAGAKVLDGYQLRYIYFIDKSYRTNLTVPELDYATIEEQGAKMYKGMRQKPKSKAAGFHSAEGGAVPTLTHQDRTNTSYIRERAGKR